MMNVTEVMQGLWTQMEGKHPVTLWEFWTIIWEKVEEEIQIEENDMNMWLIFKKLMKQILQFWKRKSKKLAVTSWDTFKEKILCFPGGTFQTCFCSAITTAVVSLFTNYADMESLDETECSALASNLTTFTSSTTARGHPSAVDVVSDDGLSLLERLNRITAKANQSQKLPQSTGLMSSFICLSSNGVFEKYSLEEKVGKYRLTVSEIYVN